MTVTYKDIKPTLIENTTMQKMLIDDVFKAYTITPNEDYVLHDKTLDSVEHNEEIGEEAVILGFYRGTKTCGANYDFALNSREFYAVLASSVPENH